MSDVTERKHEEQHVHVFAGLEIIPGATHLFEEQGALEKVVRLARQ